MIPINSPPKEHQKILLPHELKYTTSQAISTDLVMMMVLARSPLPPPPPSKESAASINDIEAIFLVLTLILMMVSWSPSSAYKSHANKSKIKHQILKPGPEANNSSSKY